jgi:hypothetical protein
MVLLLCFLRDSLGFLWEWLLQDSEWGLGQYLLSGDRRVQIECDQRSVLNMYTYSHFSLLSQKTIFSFSGIVYPHYLSFRKDFKVLPHGIFVIFDSRFVLSVLFIRKCVGFKHSNFCSWKLLKYHLCRTLLSD